MSPSIIVAVSANGIIGLENRLPWRLPADQAHFKRLTMGHHLIVGRKTYRSIGRQLPGRTMVVVSRDPNYAPPGILVAHSIEEALHLVEGDDEPFVAGGTEVYRALLPHAGRIYLTRVEKHFDGDTRFPEPNWEEWHLIHQESHQPDPENPYPFSFLIYERKAPP